MNHAVQKPYNNFFNKFPLSMPTLFWLHRLDLLHNNFSYKVPVSVNGLTHLLMLRLKENLFSSSIFGLNLPNL